MLLILAALALFVVPVAAIAAGGAFIDDDTSIFEGDIDWMAANGITLGCNPPTNDRYCPDDDVTRGQMAAFMHRLAVNKVVDAATLDGKTASDLESHAYEARVDTSDTDWVDVPSNATTDVLTLDVPAGTYLFQARAGINSKMGAQSSYTDIVCSLTAGATTQEVLNMILGANGSPGETQWASWMFTHTFATADTAILSCTASASWSGNVFQPTITAVSVQSATAAVSTASVDGSADPNG